MQWVKCLSMDKVGIEAMSSARTDAQVPRHGYGIAPLSSQVGADVAEMRLRYTQALSNFHTKTSNIQLYGIHNGMTEQPSLTITTLRRIIKMRP